MFRYAHFAYIHRYLFPFLETIEEQCQDSETTFKSRTCDDITDKPRLCKKEWISFLCPNKCNVPTTGTNGCCDDFEGRFPLKGGLRTCDFLLDNPKFCKRRKWVGDLCSLTCGICNKTEAVKKNEPTVLGIVEENKFVTGPNQPLRARVNMFGESAVKPYSSCDDLKADLKNFTSLIVNQVIHENAGLDPNSMFYRTRSFPQSEDIEVAALNPVGDEDSYDTNVQVAGVDEADIVKSTNDTVYAAYGDKLVVWEARTLKKLSVTTMPSLVKDPRKLTSIVFPYRRQVSIRGLLLYQQTLAVIVSHDQWFYPFTQSDESHKIIQNYGAVSLRLYDVSTLPDDGESELKLIATKDLQGNYIDARLVNGTAHIITSAQVDTYFHLTRHFSRYINEDRYRNMTKTEYIAKATTLAKTSVIPSFIQSFMMELDVGKQCSNLMHLTLFQSFSGVQPQNIYTIPRYSIINGIAQITSFVMENTIVGDKGLQSSSISMLLPSNYNTQIYSSLDKLVLATRGYQLYSNGTGWTENTFFQALTLTTNGTESNSIAQVPGYLLNSYAMDIWDGHLRAATTTSAKWGCLNTSSTVRDPLPMFVRFCNRTILVDSDNYIHVLRLPTNTSESTMEQVGYLNNLGKFGERIEAVRFMGDKAFVVTFFRTDPFYTIDLSDHDNPREVGALEITGYSNYLHPYDTDGNVLIGVGQDADKSGRATGLQISLFNTTDLSNVTLMKRYSVENETASWSYSSAQYEPKAFRFLPLSKRLILPSSIRNYQDFSKNFDGFLIFDLSLYDIKYSFNISHVQPKQLLSFCWYNAYLPSRSLVHGGVVTTLKGHTVLAHNLDTMEMVYPALNLDENNTVCGKGGYWVD